MVMGKDKNATKDNEFSVDLELYSGKFSILFGFIASPKPSFLF